MGQLFKQGIIFTLLLLSLPLQVVGAPSRVASINLCTDQLLLLLADSSQVASVTYLAKDANNSFTADLAAQHDVNHAKIEELITLQPDLVLANEYTDPALIMLLQQLGFQVERFANADSIQTIRNNIHQLATLLDQESRGEALIAEMDRRIELIAAKSRTTRPSALFYQVRGYTSGHHTLQDEALRLAGWQNVSSQVGINGYAPIDLETLLLAKPTQLFTSSYAPNTESVGQHQLHHPVLQRVAGGKPFGEIDYRFWICGGPMIADAIEALDVEHWQ